MHLAMVCPDLTGHLNPMTTLGRELKRRGHRVTLIGLPPAGAFAERAGLEYRPLGVKNYEEEIAPWRRRLAELTGIAALKLTGNLLRDIEAIGLRDLPRIYREEGIEAAIVDQVSPSGACVAEVLQLPFAIACNALQLHQEASTPPAVLGWKYSVNPLAKLRNIVGNRLLEWAASPIMKVIQAYRRENGLLPLRHGITAHYGLVQVAQQPAFFDFPRKRLPRHFHYTGPWHEQQRDKLVDFPWHRLNGKPLIYASMGTLQNSLQPIFRAMLQGVKGLDVQLVLSLGRADSTWNEEVPANALVVPYAPQLALLEKSSMLITHAGLNTALEGLARGLPMLCIPITNDQPGVAARIEWLKAGMTMLPGKVSAERIREAVTRLMTEPSWRSNALDYQQKLKTLLPGVQIAADLIEHAITTRKLLHSAHDLYLAA